jgi:capsular polysaccharide biosynthesis protein
MKIVSLRNSNTQRVTFSTPTPTLTTDPRETFIHLYTNVRLTGRNIHYPNCLLKVGSDLINPYDERVMSLQKDSFYDDDIWSEPQSQPQSQSTLETQPVFFFIYNVDNYYHFIYDTLPYLVAYFHLKQQIPSLRLVIHTSHPTKSALTPFVKDCLTNLGLIDAIQFADPNHLYTDLYVATSLTHGGKSNAPPSPLAFTIWGRFFASPTLQTPKRFYVSRRSWVHGQTSNMGTNYTTRRKCINENEVVDLLAKYTIVEVFTELLTMEQKIAYFKSAELVVGVIGGGMCNLLFSPQTTRSVCITTPYFLDINARFAYSMDHTRIIYSNCTQHYPYAGKFPLYSRVKIVNPANPYVGRIGEVEATILNSAGNQIQLNLSSNDVAGFSQDFQIQAVYVNETDVEPLDLGLNSPYSCDLHQLELDIKRALELD